MVVSPVFGSLSNKTAPRREIHRFGGEVRLSVSDHDAADTPDHSPRINPVDSRSGEPTFQPSAWEWAFQARPLTPAGFWSLVDR
jgi:hypothetical protein